MRKFIRLSGAEIPTTDTVTLSWDQRVRSRLRVTLDDGTPAGIFIERGAILRNGVCLIDEEGRAVRVRAAGETVSTASCKDATLLARACYHLGNRHVPLQISSAWVRYRHDHVLDEMVQSLGLEVACEQAPFEPEAGAYGGKGHNHHHDHEHAHDHA